TYGESAPRGENFGGGAYGQGGSPGAYLPPPGPPGPRAPSPYERIERVARRERDRRPDHRERES
ncbi:hypothetical protein GA0115251_12751, partial [Streptomyces sp. TverLS-915]